MGFQGLLLAMFLLYRLFLFVVFKGCLTNLTFKERLINHPWEVLYSEHRLSCCLVCLLQCLSFFGESTKQHQSTQGGCLCQMLHLQVVRLDQLIRESFLEVGLFVGLEWICFRMTCFIMFDLSIEGLYIKFISFI